MSHPVTVLMDWGPGTAEPYWAAVVTVGHQEGQEPGPQSWQPALLAWAPADSLKEENGAGAAGVGEEEFRGSIVTLPRKAQGRCSLLLAL